MNNLETLGLIALLVLIILSGGYYLVISQRNRVRDTLPLQEEEDFETAEELFPLVQFPPDTAQEYVPDLPWGYDDDKITIMARDPEWLFAYWDISQHKRDSLRHSVGTVWDSSLPVLRIHDVTGIAHFNGANSNYYFDVAINDYAGNWYVHTGVPDRTYCVELGRVLPDGAFVMIARSNFTPTPRNSVSDRIDPEWMLVSEHEKKLFARIGHPAGISSGELFNRH